MPEDGMSTGNSVPPPMWFASNARAFFAATVRRGNCFEPTKPLLNCRHGDGTARPPLAARSIRIPT